MTTRLQTCGATAADWLALAAAPTFAAAGLATALGGTAMPLCSGAGWLPLGMPLDGMPAMYLLMSLFHLAPWLRRASRPGRAA